MSRPPYRYDLYGMCVESAIACPELEPSRRSPDVAVVYGEVPENLAEFLDGGGFYQFTRRKSLIKYPEVGRFLVSDGSTITISRDPAAQDARIRTWLIGPVMSALLHQRDILPLHASAVDTECGAVALVGQGGAGKSTLAAAFHARGYGVMTDDVCAIDLNGGTKPVVVAAYPQLNLRPCSLDKLGLSPDELSSSQVMKDKYQLPVRASRRARLEAVFEICRSDVESPEVSALQGRDKVEVLRSNTLWHGAAATPERWGWYYRTMLGVASTVKFFRILRPDAGGDPEVLVERILNCLAA